MKRKTVRKYAWPFYPKIQTKLTKSFKILISVGPNMLVIQSTKFLVPIKLAEVDIELWTNSCRKWDLTSIICIYIVATMFVTKDMTLIMMPYQDKDIFTFFSTY